MRIIFLVLISLPLLACGYANQVGVKNMRDASQYTVLYDFALKQDLNDWVIVNDGVMGGVSQSKLYLKKQEGAVFTGLLSLENNGGFASTRALLKADQPNGYSGFVLRVKGDGKKYQFRVRVDGEFDGISYRHHFDTKEGEWMDVALPFDGFVTTFRGRALPDIPALSSEKIKQVGFLISDKQEGDFSLLIESIKVY